uniref:Putative secreted protein n=1 Tax=Anopheles darlingi TaxID=43151 RepID=A0A2M4D0M9_ANODA
MMVGWLVVWWNVGRKQGVPLNVWNAFDCFRRCVWFDRERASDAWSSFSSPSSTRELVELNYQQRELQTLRMRRRSTPRWWWSSRILPGVSSPQHLLLSTTVAVANEM